MLFHFPALWMLCAGILPLAAKELPPAARFVPPGEGPVPFRRDKLPVDVDTMAELSRQVAMLAGAWVADDPDELRAVAQMTALALALDPENREARNLIKTMEGGGRPKPPHDESLEKARAKAWTILAWLETPEAGIDGQALGACLGDVLAMGDPHHPKSRERRSSAERGAWKNWVAEKAAFLPKPEGQQEDEDGPGAKRKEAVLRLDGLAIPMPVWHHDKSLPGMKLDVIQVAFDGWISQGDEHEDGEAGGKEQVVKENPRFLVKVAGEGKTEGFSKPMQQVELAMTRRHGPLPVGLRIGLDFGKFDYSLSRNGLALTGSAALLLDGALTGKVPTAATLAVVGEDGDLGIPPRLWQTLRTLSDQASDLRLILPDEAADYLAALVVLEKADFFMKNEVLLAGTVDELCDLAASAPDPRIADALKRFEEIRKAGLDKALGNFVAHPSTRQRLGEVAELMPEHASARMLALRGSNSRPRFLQRPVLAQEIRSALEPLSYSPETVLEQLNPQQLNKAQEDCRAHLDSLFGYIELRDRDLHKSAMDLLDNLRSFARLLTKKDPEDAKSTPIKDKQAQVGGSIRRESLRVMRELSVAAGEAETIPPR